MFQCSPLDEIIPPLYFAYILTFETTDAQSTETLFQTLSRGHQQLLELFPILTAQITRDESNTERRGHVDLIVPANLEQDQLVKVDLTSPESQWKHSYQSLKEGGMPSSKLEARMLAPLAGGVGHTSGVFSAQFNAIPGGVLLAVCFSHTFVDANGASAIIALWSDCCNGSQQEQLASQGLKHSQDGENLVIAQLRSQSMADYQLLKEDTEAWKLLGLDWRGRSQPGSEAQIPELPLFIPAAAAPPGQSATVSKMVSFSSDALKGLKKMAAPKASCEDENWISTNDALIAFLWRHIMQARFPSGDGIHTNGTASGEHPQTAESIVTVAINGRKELSLPPSYIGNVIFCNMCTMTLQTVIAPSTELSQLAQYIRQTVRKNKRPESLSEALTLASCIPSEILRRLRYGFSDFHGPDLVTTSWIDLPLYDLEWGNWNQKSGKDSRIDFFRMPATQFEGITCILPRKKDGSVEVMVGMKTDAMNRLVADRDFLHFASFVSE